MFFATKTPGRNAPGPLTSFEQAPKLCILEIKGGEKLAVARTIAATRNQEGTKRTFQSLFLTADAAVQQPNDDA